MVSASTAPLIPGTQGTKPPLAPTGTRRHAPCECRPACCASLNGHLRGYSVGLSSTNRARPAETGIAGEQTSIAHLVLTERGGRNAGWLGDQPTEPAFTSPLHRSFRTCGPRRLRRCDRALRV